MWNSNVGYLEEKLLHCSGTTTEIMNRTIIAILLLAGALLQGCKQEIFQWRGTHRDGVFQESDLLDSWPEEGPELLWKFEGLGRGFAAPAVTKKIIYINGEEEGFTYLFALTLEGELLWKSPNGKEFLGDGFSATYPGARSTPTVLGKKVYATSGMGQIACFNSKSGKEYWSVNIVDDLDGEVAYFGYSESVGVDDKHVYCYPGGPRTNLAALDRMTGKIAWTQSALRDTFAYGSPVLIERSGKPMLMHTSRHHLMILNPSNGELLTSYNLEGYEYDGEHCNTPVYDNGNIYFVGNDIPGQGAFKLELSLNGKEIKELWRNPEVKNNFGGLVAVDGSLFTTVPGNRLVSLDSESGVLADTLRVATGSIIFADNKFIVYGNNGTVNLVNYEQYQLKPAGQFKVKEGTGHHFSHPVLADGVMYIRHGDALMAYRIK
jgi:outer membrane protein assembly factor BamB